MRADTKSLMLKLKGSVNGGKNLSSVRPPASIFSVESEKKARAVQNTRNQLHPHPRVVSFGGK